MPAAPPTPISPPSARAALLASGLGWAGASIGHATVSGIGPGPWVIIGLIAALLIGWGLGAEAALASPGGRHAHAARLLMIGPLLLLLGQEGLLRATWEAGLTRPPWLPPALLLVAWGLGAMPAGWLTAHLRWGLLNTLGLALGMAAAAVSPAWMGLAGGALIIALSPPPPLAPRGATVDNAIRWAALLGAGATGGALWLALRGATDPTALAILQAGTVAVVSTPIGRRLGARRAGGALLLVAAVALGTALGMGLLPSWLDAAGARVVWVPAAVGVIGGLLLGLARGSRPARGATIAVGLGLWLGVMSFSSLAWLAAALAVTLAVLGRGSWTRMAGGLLALAAIAAPPFLSPTPTAELARGRARLANNDVARQQDTTLRAQMSVALATINRRGSAVVRTPQRRRAGEQPLHVEIDGVVRERTGRAADAEAMAGHLGGLLAPELDRVLVLGDDTGRALGGLLPHRPTRTLTSAPMRQVTRSVAELDAEARQRWLDPSVALSPLHPDALLRAAGPQDLVVEIMPTSWADATTAGLGADHLDAVRGALNDDGTYVLCLHLGLVPPTAAAAAAHALAARFPAVQAWLPPRGADSLLLVAAAEPPSLARLQTRAAQTSASLRELGFPSPLSLASHAIAARSDLLTWQASAPLPSPDRLSPMTGTTPASGLGQLAAHLSPPDRIWSDGANAGPELDAMVQHQRNFLELLTDAAKGDMAAVFASAQALSDADDPVATQKLQTLIAPQLRQARQALARARSSGGGRGDWEEAERVAMTARMLAPQSPEPWLLLADIALAQGNLGKAAERYQQALAHDPDRIEAQWGLARVAQRRKDLPTAERLLTQAASGHPRNWQAWQNLGALLLEAHKLGPAEDAFEHAQTLDVQGSAAPTLGLIEVHLAQGDPTQALVEVERVIRNHPSGYAWMLRGRAHYDLERYELAEEDFRRAVLLDPQLAAARGGIGQVRAMRQDWDGAAEAFRSVLQLDPDNEAAQENLRRVEQARQQAASRTQSPRTP